MFLLLIITTTIFGTTIQKEEIPSFYQCQQISQELNKKENIKSYCIDKSNGILVTK